MSIIRAFQWLFGRETEHFSGKIGVLRWSILVGKQKQNVQKPSQRSVVRWRNNQIFSDG